MSVVYPVVTVIATGHTLVGFVQRLSILLILMCLYCVLQVACHCAQ